MAEDLQQRYDALTLALNQISSFNLPYLSDQVLACQKWIIDAEYVLTKSGNVEHQMLALDLLFQVGTLVHPTLLKMAYSKLKHLFERDNRDNLYSAREYCIDRFSELLNTWSPLSTRNLKSLKKSLVKLFLAMKYYDDVPIETNVLLGEDFDYREEFIGVAKKIVEKYENDEEKMRHREFTPTHVVEKMIAPAEILIQNNRTGISEINIVMIGLNRIGKSCLGNSFARPPENRKLREGNCIGEAMTTRVETVEFALGHRKVTIKDTPGYVATQPGQASQLPFHDLPSYIEYISELVTVNTPDRNEPKIHLVLFCLNGSGFERWQTEVINAISGFVQVLVVKLQCDSEQNADHLALLRTSLNNPNVSSFHAVLAKDKTINGQTIHAFGMHDLARAMARELELWQAKNAELTEMYYTRRDAYFDKLKKSGSNLILGFAAAIGASGLSPIAFTDALAITPLYCSMLFALIRLYGVRSSTEVVQVLGRCLSAGDKVITVSAVIGAGFEIMKFLPGLNLVGMIGAAGLQGTNAIVAGGAFLYVIDKNCRKGGSFAITKENQQQILDEIVAARNGNLQ